MKKTKSNLAAKLILISAAVMIGVVLVSNFFSLFVFKGLESENGIYIVFITATLCLIVGIAVFFLLIYLLVLKRLFILNKAVQQVAKGDYTVAVPDKGNDEISTLSQNFNGMTKELQLNAMLNKNFVTYVSHEFKTPLAVIRMHAEALPTCNETELTDYSEVILSETDKLTELSKNIIMLCRLDSTNIVEKKDVFMPSAQIKSFVLATQKLWSSKNITMDVDIEDFGITGNESLTHIIWQNLIGNASKFTQENGRIAVTLHKEHNLLKFSVSDDGIGIADADKEKIFNLFFMGDKSRNGEGSGIGLYLTKTIVEKLGGSISFTSEQGKGSCFTVVLPV